MKEGILFKGQVYTIAGFGTHMTFDRPVVFLNETQNASYGADVGFRPSRFRPVLKRDTKAGMEVLKKLLNPANHKYSEKV